MSSPRKDYRLYLIDILESCKKNYFLYKRKKREGVCQRSKNNRRGNTKYRNDWRSGR